MVSVGFLDGPVSWVEVEDLNPVWEGYLESREQATAMPGAISRAAASGLVLLQNPKKMMPEA